MYVDRELQIALPPVPPLLDLPSNIEVVGLSGHVCSVSLMPCKDRGYQPLAVEVLRLIQDEVTATTALPICQQHLLLNESWDTATLVRLPAPQIEFRYASNVEMQTDHSGNMPQDWMEKGYLELRILDSEAARPRIALRNAPPQAERTNYKIHPRLQRAAFLESGMLQLKPSTQSSQTEPLPMPLEKHITIVKWRYTDMAQAWHPCPVHVACDLERDSDGKKVLHFSYKLDPKVRLRVDSIKLTIPIASEAVKNAEATVGNVDSLPEENARHAKEGRGAWRPESAAQGFMRLRRSVSVGVPMLCWHIAPAVEGACIDIGGSLLLHVLEHVEIKGLRCTGEVRCSTSGASETFGPGSRIPLLRCRCDRKPIAEEDEAEDFVYSAVGELDFSVVLDLSHLELQERQD